MKTTHNVYTLASYNTITRPIYLIPVSFRSYPQSILLESHAEEPHLAPGQVLFSTRLLALEVVFSWILQEFSR
jgi:hypothetical protein